MHRVKFSLGQVVSVRRGFVKHVGIVTRIDWTGFLITSQSGRAGEVLEETSAQFSGGKEINYEGYPGTLHPNEVVCRARSMLGQPYNAFKFNCEHFVQLAHGLPPESPQLRGFLTLGLVGGVAVSAFAFAALGSKAAATA